MIIVNTLQIDGVTAPITPAEQALFPLTHASGAARYVCGNADGQFALDALMSFRQRTQTEIEATPEYQAYIGNHPELLPELWVALSLTPQSTYHVGASGLQAFPNSAAGAFKVSASVWGDNAKTVPITQLDGQGWVFVLRKINQVDGMLLDTLRPFKLFASNLCEFTITPTGISSGRYSLDERDFTTLDVGGQVYQFKLIAPNSPENRPAFEFDIYDASL